MREKLGRVRGRYAADIVTIARELEYLGRVLSKSLLEQGVSCLGFEGRYIRIFQDRRQVDNCTSLLAHVQMSSVDLLTLLSSIHCPVILLQPIPSNFFLVRIVGED
jgi:hypothetical protein